jgi:hypothetical protein
MEVYMLAQIGHELFNLSHVRSVSKLNQKCVVISFVDDGQHEVNLTLTEAMEFFNKMGFKILQLTENDFVLQHNVLTLSKHGHEITVIYTDGVMEYFSSLKPLNEIIPEVPLLGQPEEQNLDEDGIPSDLQEEEPESRMAIGIQLFIALAVIATVIVLAYNGKV